MSDYDSDGYEYEHDYDDEIFEETRVGKEKYREYLKRSFESVNNKINDLNESKGQNAQGLTCPYVYMFSDSDADKGLLEGVGGYYNVVQVDIKSIRPRRHIVNALTYGYLMLIQDSIRNLKPLTDVKLTDQHAEIIQSKTDKQLDFDENLAAVRQITSVNDQWKDFKYFLTQKYFHLSKEKINSIFSSSVKDVFNQNYLEFLLHKARFLYKNYYGVEDVKQLSRMANCLTGETFEIQDDENELPTKIYQSSIYNNINRVFDLHKECHVTAVSSFCMINKLPLLTKKWTSKENLAFKEFLGRSTTVSYIELRNDYNINYISAQRTKNKSCIKDRILKILKLMVKDFIYQFSLLCKSYKRINLIKSHFQLHKQVDAILEVVKAAGCNAVTYYNGMSFETIFQTTLNNVLQISLPIDVFETGYQLNLDSCFLNYTNAKYGTGNNLFYSLRHSASQSFYSSFKADDYGVFLFTYYSRLNSVKLQNLESWCKKSEHIKAKIYASSTYVKNIMAVKIQRFYKLFIKGMNYKEQARLEEEKRQERLDELLLDEEELLQKYAKEVEAQKKQMKLAEIEINNSNSAIDGNFSKIQYNRYENSQNLLGTKLEINLSNRLNTEKKWFGFNKNKQLCEMILSVGSSIELLDIKHTYKRQELLDIVDTVGKICVITKSKQYIKLCRILSGTKQKENTLRDFVQGFCWMYTQITYETFMKAATTFCAITNNSKWYTYLINNRDTITTQLYEF